MLFNSSEFFIFFAIAACGFFLFGRFQQRVVVVGGYPTYAEGLAITSEAVSGIELFYESRGHYFLNLENKGRYPKTHFFDTIYHLAEPYQLEHSQRVGDGLKELFGR